MSLKGEDEREERYDKVYDRIPRISVIDIIPKSRSVNHGQFHFELFLFQFSFDDIFIHTPLSSVSVRVRSRREMRDANRFQWFCPFV